MAQPNFDALSPELRGLVAQTVTVLGEVIRRELGARAYRQIENLRRSMKSLRHRDQDYASRLMARELQKLARLDRNERLHIARAFTLMLELMNACENAYRSHRIRGRRLPLPKHPPDSMIYVLTAHPTEARSPQNIVVFHEIQKLLTDSLSHPGPLSVRDKNELRHWIEVAWKTPIVRLRKPRVHDEAEHVYSTLLREETLCTILSANRDIAPIFVRSWVGGDKDGHPGVNERTFIDSLTLSRKLILDFARARLNEVAETARAMRSNELDSLCKSLNRSFSRLRRISRRDGSLVSNARAHLRELSNRYEERVGEIHPSLAQLRQLIRCFPGLVVPLEFRESSDMLTHKSEGPIAIEKMLRELALISQGGQPRWYVRGLIVSMTESWEHIRLAAKLVHHTLGSLKIPVVPLFEEAASLEEAPKIIGTMLRDPAIQSARRKHWDGYLEMMVGYSDSSKESGVLPSRLKIAQAMHALDRLCSKKGVTPIFFQGSGGSVDRGGGTIAEQTAWWPEGALRNYKVTVQGEMVERSLASPEITRGQLERIALSAGHNDSRPSKPWKPHPGVIAFAERVALEYRQKVHDPDLLAAIEKATPYPFLGRVRLGSRPSRRSQSLSVESLRAIPWVLCWTQTRVLLPTWWGVGSAWRKSTPLERQRLRRAYRSDPLFSTYVRALGFTLAKVELAVWKIYLEESGLDPSCVERLWSSFRTEHEQAIQFAQQILGTEELLSWKPWLQESITLRSPMIHPLNLLQILAMKKKDLELLRLTVTGISSGMMTTG